MSVLNEKKLWRQKMHEQRTALRPDEKKEKSQQICQNLLSSQLTALLLKSDVALTIGVFYPFSDEPQIQPFLESLLHTSHRLAFPFFNSVSAPPKFYIPQSLHEWHNLPVAPKLLEPSQLSLVFLPGVAFSETGERLGRGRGFYDRALAELSDSAVSIGVCFACQILPKLPTEPHDQCVDAICSETKFDSLGSKTFLGQPI